MMHSSAKARRTVRFFLCLLLLLLPAALRAEDDTPRALIPGENQPEKASNGKVVNQNLDQAVALGEIGLFTPAEAGFSSGFWHGLPFREIQAGLKRLSPEVSSPAAHDIMRRFLAVRTRLPGDPTPDEHEAHLTRRAELLFEIGDWDAARALIEKATQNHVVPPLARIHTASLLLDGNYKTACPVAGKRLKTDGGAYWEKALIICHFARDNTEKAALGLSLLRESGHKAPNFYDLADQALKLKDLTVSTLEKPDPLLLALIRAARIRVPENLAVSKLPWALKAVARMPHAETVLKLRAAENATARGALPPAEMARLYSEITFAAEELSSPLSTAREDPSPRTRALLYQTAESRQDPVLKAEVLGQMMELAADADLFPPLARVVAPLAGNIEPAPELAWFTRWAIPMFLSLSDLDSAQKWYELAARSSGTDSDASAAKIRFKPWLQMASPETQTFLTKADFSKWAQNAGSHADTHRKQRFLSLLSATGAHVPLSAWMEVLSTTHTRTSRPSHALQQALRRAGERKLQGPVLLLGLQAGGGNLPANTPLETLHTVLSALNAAGLKTDMRRLAIDSLLDGFAG